ncbi:MAG: hypothetical protein Q9M91_03085 [Candidatus Dojkabacteria bacterium]|nr:hypothetical protein [Candidatus Dojkabacteria bacterium]
MDEATNALDSESKVLVQEAIEKFTKNRTVISVAHRLSTISKADKIFVLEKGGLKESGTHKELLQLNGVYKKLHDIQSGEFEKTKEGFK